MARAYAISLLEIVQDPNDINRREHARAEAAAAEGAELAVRHGIDADPQAPQVSGRVDDAILAYVAHDILQRARRPVLVVPSTTEPRTRRAGSYSSRGMWDVE